MGRGPGPGKQEPEWVCSVEARPRWNTGLGPQLCDTDAAGCLGKLWPQTRGAAYPNRRHISWARAGYGSTTLCFPAFIWCHLQQPTADTRSRKGGLCRSHENLGRRCGRRRRGQRMGVAGVGPWAEATCLQTADPTHTHTMQCQDISAGSIILNV